MAEDLDARHAEARRQLLAIPGVVGVGYGYRERAGVLTGELALRVYVREKRPPEHVPPEELVPAEVAGLPTDVLRVREVTDYACENLASFDPVIGGIGISNLKVAPSGGSAGSGGIGTLGCLATLDRSSSRDRFVGLTNNHVLAAGGGAFGDRVYNPHLERDSSGAWKPLSPERSHPIGKIVDVGRKGHRGFTHPGETSISYYIDCGILSISTCFSSWCDTNIGIGVENEIHTLDVGGSRAVEGVVRLKKSDLPVGGTYTVYKLGRTTGKTVGKVADTNGTVGTDPATARNNVLIIDNLGPNCGGGTKFADHGDSGSVIVNDQRKVVALLFGGDDALGTGYGSHIHPVLDLLGITLVSTANPITPTGGGTLRELTASADQADVARAATLRAAIVASERGRAYGELVERHRTEVMALVNHVRPVTIAWHRVHGPDYLAHAVHASRHASHRVPRAIDGVDREAATARLRDALAHHGSAGLREDLERHDEELRMLLTEVESLEELAERVDATAGVP
jgi:hypothetical protein